MSETSGSAPAETPGSLSAVADQRLMARLAEGGAQDPRPLYRPLLLELRGKDEASFRAMVGHFESEVVARIAETSVDPLEAWLQYGFKLAGALGGEGEFVLIEASGQSGPCTEALPSEGLILFLPTDPRARGIPVRLPDPLSPPQQATLDLLVHGKVRGSHD